MQCGMRLGLFFLSLLSLIGCGQKQVEHKNYRFYIAAEDNGLRRAVDDMILRYNETVGVEIFHIVADPVDANSTVEFMSDMQKKDGKIGFGTWYTHESDSSDWAGMNTTVNVEYSMRLQFDEDYTRARLDKSPSDRDTQELFLLFCHEAGHGLKMEHSNDADSVMHPTVYWQDSVKMNEYFARVRAFFE